jgi:hypothetical protein
MIYVSKSHFIEPKITCHRHKRHAIEFNKTTTPIQLMLKLFNHPKSLIPMTSMDNDEKLYQRRIDKKEKINHLAWHTWNKSMKLSKHNLLNDLNDIDPIVQRHMTIASTTACATIKDVTERKQCHRQRQDPNLTATTHTYSTRLIHRNHFLKQFSLLTRSRTIPRRFSNHLHSVQLASSFTISDHEYWCIH